MNHFIEVNKLKKYFQTQRGLLRAVDDVSFYIDKGETLGLVGESGCGKSTLGRCLIRLLPVSDGRVDINGVPIFSLNKSELKKIRKKIQIVFQDPYSSLDPRFSIFDLIAEPLKTHNKNMRNNSISERIFELMDIVGLARRLAYSYPHELDGGRRQRIGIARALALNPEFIILDEPVSALDVCIQAQIINLLMELQKTFGYTYLFISHDLSVVKHISHRIAVMYLGQIVELSDYINLFRSPMHPYTQALLSAIPLINFEKNTAPILLEGDVPSPIDLPPGCRFYGRCRFRKDICLSEPPSLRELSPGHFVSCHFAGIKGINHENT